MPKAPKSTVPLKSVSTLQMLLLSKQRVLAVDPQHVGPRPISAFSPVGESESSPILTLAKSVHDMPSHEVAAGEE